MFPYILYNILSGRIYYFVASHYLSRKCACTLTHALRYVNVSFMTRLSRETALKSFDHVVLTGIHNMCLQWRNMKKVRKDSSSRISGNILHACWFINCLYTDKNTHTHGQIVGLQTTVCLVCDIIKLTYFCKTIAMAYNH